MRDNGIGIAPDMLPRIFDLFVQDAQALDRSQGGLGIGLTLVRSLVELHGGTVSARSDGPGRGSEFVVRLPVAAAIADVDRRAGRRRHASVASPRGRRARSSSSTTTTTRAEMLAEALARHGLRHARGARRADGAARRAREFSPDVAFLDIGLPVMDGYELAAHLRELPGLPGLRADRRHRLRPGARTGRSSRTAGFDRHLVKPVDIEAIEATLVPEE